MKALMRLAALLIFGLAPALAAEPVPIVAVDSIAAMQSLDGGRYPHVHVAGYFVGSRKGGGDFSFVPGAAAAPDTCLSFAGSGGVWQRELPAGMLDVTMCGAKWDGHGDDAAALSAAFTVAARAGVTLSCPGGTGLIGHTVAPSSFAGVMFRCAGMDASTVRCAVSKGAPCLLFQNPKGAGEVPAPQFYDFNILASGAGTVIQYNSVAGGFTDDATSQGYMMRPVVQRVRIAGGAIGILCAKCFDGDISLDSFWGQDRHGIDLEGSDWMSVGDAGANRVVGAGDFAIRLASHGTFGNGDLVSHNDLLSPKRGAGYIYSSARTAYIEKNFMEGLSRAPCEIKIDLGASHAVVRDNHVTDPTVAHWLCVVPALRQAEFSSNQTTSHGQGAALFENRGSWKDLILHHAIVHFGNWSEEGFPANWLDFFRP